MNKSKTGKLQLLLALTIALVSANAAIAQPADYFDVEPQSAQPKPQAEAPRAIIMDMSGKDEPAQKHSKKLSFFKHTAQAKPQITSNDSHKDVPEEDSQTGVRGGIARAISMPKTAAGVMCGVMVGVPVKAAKTMVHERARMSNQVTADVGGDNPDLTAKFWGNCLSAPYGLATGLVVGVFKGTERAIECGRRKPFSKESMSLTDPELK